MKNLHAAYFYIMTFCCDYDYHAPKWTKEYHKCIKNTLKFKSLSFFEVSSARQGRVYHIKNTVNTVILSTIILQLK